MRIIAIINQKGGCGKTTSAINLAGIMARKGLRTLLVDMDPQSHCAAGLAIPEQRIDLDIGDAMLAGPDDAIDPKRLFWRASRNLDLAPSRMKTAGLEASRGGLSDKPDKEHRLAGVLTRFAKNYDVCFLDCPPTIGLLTFNALAAATEILIPVETSFFSLQGATKQVNTIRTLAKRLGTSAPYWLFATIHDEGSVLAKDLLDELRRRFGKRVAPDVIRRDLTLKEAASFGQPVVEYSPESIGAQDYGALAGWLAGVTGVSADSRPRTPDAVQAGPEEVFQEVPTPLDPPTVQVIGGVEDKLGLGKRYGVSPEEAIGPGATPVRGKDEAPTASPFPREWTDPPSGPADRATPPENGGVSTAPLSEPPVALFTRAEDLAQRARVMLLRRADEELKKITGLVPDPAISPLPLRGTDFLGEPKSVVTRADSARTRDESIRALLGVRQTRSGVLFVQPLTLGASVAIAGDFNGWAACPMRRNEQIGVFELCLPLPPGRRQYRLVVDGHWVADSFNPLSELNPFGEPNSVIQIVQAPQH